MLHEDRQNQVATLYMPFVHNVVIVSRPLSENQLHGSYRLMEEVGTS